MFRFQRRVHHLFVDCVRISAKFCAGSNSVRSGDSPGTLPPLFSRTLRPLREERAWRSARATGEWGDLASRRGPGPGKADPFRGGRTTGRRADGTTSNRPPRPEGGQGRSCRRPAADGGNLPPEPGQSTKGHQDPRTTVSRPSFLRRPGRDLLSCRRFVLSSTGRGRGKAFPRRTAKDDATTGRRDRPSPAVGVRGNLSRRPVSPSSSRSVGPVLQS